MSDSEWVNNRYSILNKLKINNWTMELRISKEYIINDRKDNEEQMIRRVLFIRIATFNKEVNKEPANILIDKRLDKVNDWEIVEKDSSINEIIKNTSILVKNTYNRYEDKIKPKYPLYTNQLINTIIVPNR